MQRLTPQVRTKWCPTWEDITRLSSKDIRNIEDYCCTWVEDPNPLHIRVQDSNYPQRRVQCWSCQLWVQKMTKIARESGPDQHSEVVSHTKRNLILHKCTCMGLIMEWRPSKQLEARNDDQDDNASSNCLIKKKWHVILFQRIIFNWTIYSVSTIGLEWNIWIILRESEPLGGNKIDWPWKISTSLRN